jgi:hypothetical protein
MSANKQSDVGYFITRKAWWHDPSHSGNTASTNPKEA